MERRRQVKSPSCEILSVWLKKKKKREQIEKTAGKEKGFEATIEDRSILAHRKTKARRGNTKIESVEP